MASAGRPSKYLPEYAEQAAKLAKLGATDIEIADFFKIGKSTLNRWKAEHDGFRASIKTAKKEADARVERSLYERACGYEHEEVHVSNYQGAVTLTPIRKIYPPDTAAAAFWLKNRAPDRWREIKAVELTGAGGGPVQTAVTRIELVPLSGDSPD